MSTVFMPRILAELPEGWSAIDAVQLFGPGAVQVKVTAEQVGEGTDTAGLASRHGESLAEVVPGYCQVDLAEACSFSGHTVLRRKVTYGGADQPFRGISVYLVDGDVAYVASATGPADAFDAIEHEVDAITDRLTLLGSPLVHQHQFDGDRPAAPSAVSRTTFARPALAADAWAELRSEWEGSPAPPSDALDEATPLSAEELLVVAGLLGAGVFPTVAPHALAAQTNAERSAAARALMRSLVTRGVLEEDDDDLLVVSPGWRSLEIALYPDLLVEVSSSGAAGVTTTAFCVRPDVLVVVGSSGPFGRRVTMGDPAELVDLVVAQVASAEGTDPGWSCSLRSSWREGRSLVGGELRWSHDADSVAEDEVRRALLDVLPGPKLR